MPSEESRALATGYMHKKFGEVWPCGFQVCKQVNGQTNRETDIQRNKQTYPSQYFKPITEVM